MLNTFFATILFLLLSASAVFGADKSSSNQPTYLVSGDAQLLTHFIDRGLSISDQNPALNASFLFNLGQQFRVGFWGSNISNVTSTDDNLWLKVVADIKVEISGSTKLIFYINDDHYYKSNLRNGQEVGTLIDTTGYFFQFEFFNNFQGTKTAGEYVKAGKKFPLGAYFTGTAAAGYTLQHSDNVYSNYLDGKATANYQLNQFLNIEGGVTTALGASGYGQRASSFYYLGIKLSY